MPAPSRPVTRRTALALSAAGLAGLAACGVERGSGLKPSAQVAADPDAALVDEAIAQISATAAVVAQEPRLSALHAAHLAALEADPATAPTDAPTSVPATPAQVRRAERALRAFLVEASVQAESGTLARLFASMSAAVAQQLAVLARAAS